MEEIHVTAEQYRAGGWETVELPPSGAMTFTYDATVDSEPRRAPYIDVLVLDSEYAVLAESIDGREFDRHRCYGPSTTGSRSHSSVFESANGELAVFVPASHELSDLDDLRRKDTVYTYVRSLFATTRVAFSHAEPEPLSPDEDDASDAEGDAGDGRPLLFSVDGVSVAALRASDLVVPERGR